MNNDKVVKLKNPGIPGEVRDPLTEVLRQGDQQLLAQAIETEVVQFLERHREMRDDVGRRRLVRNGHLPSRTIQTGIGGDAGARPAGAGPQRRNPLHLLDPAAVFTAHEDDRGTAAVALSQGDLHGRFQRGAHRAIGPRCPGALRRHDQPLEGGLDRRTCALGTAQPREPTVRVVEWYLKLIQCFHFELTGNSFASY